ncbi:endoplasmic reticulum vesicle protein 25 [Kwoniella mangroviensis CBS 10435]|uniref:Endoplasmic reticulum vesicle protein 25 n=1 Tax=Kwoniella mangroviensis CBS 10435 TaxID=1331196 RepID=A0A1B9IIK6_9TREE|nr:endoplasmic reticulum vesicle protein 25 [Kwoniella mangroviensis CBS 10435]OCF72042.1 endoplasmic reticulum vesicle protein 25 [Kwoniella mangroviensis CBS 8886]
MIFRPILFFLSLISAVYAVKFDLVADRYPKPRCIWNFAAAHSLVIVTANVPYENGQRVDIEILDGSERGNVYLNKKDIKGETRLAITTHESADVGVCLRNYLESDSHEKLSRSVDLDVDIGADAIDYNAIANQESLSILEVEMRKLEAVVKEIVEEMGYLQRREMRMRDTNESTNSRVKNFSILITVGIIGLGAWQLVHLRSFFKRKYLID